MPTRKIVATLFAVGFALYAGSATAVEPHTVATADSSEMVEVTIAAPAIEATSSLDMRDDEYNTDYIFGMTKSVANSTWVAPMKVLFFVVTLPLDIVLLPFAAIGGFF